MFTSIRAKLITILIILGVFPLSIVTYLAYESASNALLFQARSLSAFVSVFQGETYQMQQDIPVY